MTNDISDLLLSNLKLRRSAIASEGRIGTVSGTIDENGVIRSVGNLLIDGERMPRIDVSVDKEDVIRDESGKILASVVLVRLLDLEGGLEILAVNVFAKIDPELDGDLISERLIGGIRRLEVGELGTGLIGPLAHRLVDIRVGSIVDHRLIFTVQALSRREDMVRNLDISVERRHSTIDIPGKTITGGRNVPSVGLLEIVLHESLPVAHQILHRH